MNTKTLCLAILSTQDASGYEIKKLSQEGVFSHFVDASFGSIYPALTRMEQDGLVCVREEFQSGKPPNKIYSITDLGREEFIQALHGPTKNDVHKSEFLLIAMFAPMVSKSVVETALQKQKEYYIRELENISQHCENHQDLSNDAGSDWVAKYGQEILQNCLNFLNENGDQLLAAAGTQAMSSVVQAAE